ncbi:MAG: DEAD/DEAH box helicase family protein, partial [Planctomycetota bacterium]
MIPLGLYERILTRALSDALRQAPGHGLYEIRKNLSKEESHIYLAQFVKSELCTILEQIGDVPRQVEVSNAILKSLRELAKVNHDERDEIAEPGQMLQAVYQGVPPERPETPLAISTLLARPGKPDLGHELAREIASADRIDALVSFVKWEGFRRLRPALEAYARAGRPLRLLTTTYTGATDADAVREIARLPGVQVRVSLDGRRTRLHAKAWLFHRDSGFTTAYIGSANLSGPALSGGLEWMMKVTQADLPHVLEVFRGAFESFWNDPEFESFDPERDYERLEEVLGLARRAPHSRAMDSKPLFFTLRPHAFQEEILNILKTERDLRGHRRNLIVAATGTGKTMIAAFDYARQPSRPRLLFVAHRREILEQALSSFRHVLHDGAFGELL